jgi:ABC-type multidrug transport system permease subunit
MWMPQEVLTLSLVISPLSWSLSGYSEVLARGGPNTARVLMDCAMLLLFAAAFFATGLWKFSWSAPPEA